MTFRLATILGVLLIGLAGSVGTVSSLAPKDIANHTTFAAAGLVRLAATDAKIKACRQACVAKYRCKKDKTIGHDPALRTCLKEAKDCKDACSN